VNKHKLLHAILPAILVLAGAQTARSADGPPGPAPSAVTNTADSDDAGDPGDGQSTPAQTASTDQSAQNQTAQNQTPPAQPGSTDNSAPSQPQPPQQSSGTRYSNAGQNIPVDAQGNPIKPGVPIGATDVPTFNIMGRIPLQLSGYLQPRFTQQPGTNSAISIKRARLILNGSLNRIVDFYFQIDATLSPVLLDAYINVKPESWLKFRVGQFKVGFSEESLLGDDILVPVERSLVVNKFSPDRDISAQGRDVGAQAYGSFKATGRSILDYWVGVFDGGGIYNVAPNHHKAVVERVILHPIKGMNVGADYYTGPTGTAPAVLAPKQREDLEAGYERGKFYAYGEYLLGRDGGIHRSGGYGLVAWRFSKRIDAFLRDEDYNAQHDKAHQITRIYMAGANYYPVKLLKFGADYGVQKDPVKGTLGTYALVQLQAGW
jgi:hypothetical protein